MNHMLKYLTEHPDKGLLGYESMGFANIQYWRSFDHLEAFAKDLTGREEILFRERWLTDEPKTLQEIGDSFGISRERARQLEKRMLDRLREYLQDEFGSSVDIGAMVDE